MAVKVKEGWVLVESPVAILASHEVASSACWIAAESKPDADSDPDSDPGPSGESLEDFRLHKHKFQK